MSKAIVVSAVPEVSNDQFVAACVAFQQAKVALAQHLGQADLTQLDTVSSAVYDLANKALRRKMKDEKNVRQAAVHRGERKPFYEIIASAVQGRKKFTIPDVVEALKKRGQLPEAMDIPAYISTTLGTHKERFTRVERGVYKFKGTRRLLTLKRQPKALPAVTS